MTLDDSMLSWSLVPSAETAPLWSAGDGLSPEAKAELTFKIEGRRELGDIWAWCKVSANCALKGCASLAGSATATGLSFESPEAFHVSDERTVLMDAARADLERKLAAAAALWRDLPRPGLKVGSRVIWRGPDGLAKATGLLECLIEMNVAVVRWDTGWTGHVPTADIEAVAVEGGDGDRIPG